MITETDEIAEAIDDAAVRWPEDAGNCAALLRRLVLEGARSGAEELVRRRQQRLAAIDAISGMFNGVYPPNAARDLVNEWPE